MNILVSIIINNYNYAAFVPKAIDSSIQQTYSHLEVIVVDDCSTDNSRDIISSYGEYIIPIFHETNGKQGAAFNSGFANSTGDIIIFLDADDYLYPHAVEHIVQHWQPGLAKLHYRLDVVDSDGHSLDYSYPQGGKLAIGDIHQTILTRGTYSGVPTSGNALSRNALAQVMPIPPKFNTTSDDYLSVLIPFYGDVGAIEAPLGAYRIHTSNQWAMSTISAERFHRFIRHDLQRCELLKTKGPELGYTVPEDLEMRFLGRVWSRLSSLKFDPPSHPVPGDRSFPLAVAGLRAVWYYSDHNWQKKIIFSLWFLWVGLMPPLLAKPAITWLFAPQFRPKPINWTLTQLRALVST
jgi:glycosyltransferase involved in cell wall biosynthesis